MTSPWPSFDPKSQSVMCCLCFESKRLEELSRDLDGHLTDVCLVCRQRELQAILSHVAGILSLDNQLAKPKHPDSEPTQVIQLKYYPCGHIDDGCWCLQCHYCDRVADED